MIGTVVRVFLNKGYAFLRGEDSMSYFAHAKDFKDLNLFDCLYEGQKLEFEPGLAPEQHRSKGNERRAYGISQCSL